MGTVRDPVGAPNSKGGLHAADDARDRLVSKIVGHLKDGVSKPVLERAIEDWRNINQGTGDRVAKGVS